MVIGEAKHETFLQVVDLNPDQKRASCLRGGGSGESKGDGGGAVSR